VDELGVMANLRLAPALPAVPCPPARPAGGDGGRRSPHGRHYYWRSWKLPPLSDRMIVVIVEHAARITSPFSAVPSFTLGGAVARVAEDATAHPGRTATGSIDGWSR
jgi:hypothetical protein